MAKQGAISLEGIVFKFDTIKTFSPVHGEKRDIVIIVGISPLEIRKFEDEYKIKYFVYVPWNIEECISWLRAHSATEILSQKKLEPHNPIDKKVEKAIDWLKGTSFPNEGFHHPLDEDRLKSVSNALHELNISIEAESIMKYCHENGILYKAAYKMIDFFQKAKTTRLRTRDNYKTDFLERDGKKIDIATYQGLKQGLKIWRTMISYDILISQTSSFLVDLERINQSVQLSANQTIDSPGIPQV
ncbi:MAG: hypothetical protein LUH63_05895 [Parabacteroides sp.]|nr:hypothetical protein [Parabacteroides sp.]